MYQLYERIPKTVENLYGLKKVEEDRNPFLEQPCFLSIMALIFKEKEVNGAIKTSMEMARLRTSNNTNSRYDIKDFPVKFLSMDFGKRASSEKSGIIEFTEKYFFPLISRKGVRLDVEQAKRNMRNVNIMTYCNGTNFVLEMEDILIAKMQEIGYTEDEIEQILSQMCLFPISTDVLERKNVTSTCMSFRDINDEDIPIEDKWRENFRKKYKFGEAYGGYKGKKIWEYIL